jgi:hypothetical protein
MTLAVNVRPSWLVCQCRFTTIYFSLLITGDVMRVAIPANPHLVFSAKVDCDVARNLIAALDAAFAQRANEWWFCHG